LFDDSFDTAVSGSLDTGVLCDEELLGDAVESNQIQPTTFLNDSEQRIVEELLSNPSVSCETEPESTVMAMCIEVRSHPPTAVSLTDL